MISSSTTVVIASNTSASAYIVNLDEQVYDMWGSWAVYTAFILLGVLIFGIAWGYQRDKRDDLGYKKITLTKEKLYCNLYLEPLPDEELAKIEDDENDYEAI